MDSAISHAAFDRLHMLAPQAVPAEISVAEWIAGSGREIASQSAGACKSQEATNGEVADALAQLASRLPQSQVPCASGQSHEDDRAHDAYFHVYRVHGCTPRIFARMAISARLILMREVDQAPVTVSTYLLGLIDGALAELIECVCGESIGKYVPRVSTWRTRGAASQPMARWVHGHQIFAALSQGLIFSFQSLGRAIRAGDGEQVRRWAGLSTSLLEASGAAFLFTGDFSVEAYTEIVRPSMTPPASSISLSGLMSEDHRFLMQTIRDLRPALKALHEQEPALHDRLQQELGIVYDRHIHICERFVGEKPSLLTARHAKKSGPGLIEQFKTLRMKAFDSSLHASRLVMEPVHVKPEVSALASCPFSTAASSEQREATSCPKDL